MENGLKIKLSELKLLATTQLKTTIQIVVKINIDNSHRTYTFNFISSRDQNLGSGRTVFPEWKYMRISNDGVVRIFFTQELKVPKDLSKIDFSALYIELIPGSDVANPEKLKFTWLVFEFEPYFITIQLKFENPAFISSRGKTK